MPRPKFSNNFKDATKGVWPFEMEYKEILSKPAPKEDFLRITWKTNWEMFYHFRFCTPMQKGFFHLGKPLGRINALWAFLEALCSGEKFASFLTQYEGPNALLCAKEEDKEHLRITLICDTWLEYVKYDHSKYKEWREKCWPDCRPHASVDVILNKKHFIYTLYMALADIFVDDNLEYSQHKLKEDDTEEAQVDSLIVQKYLGYLPLTENDKRLRHALIKQTAKEVEICLKQGGNPNALLPNSDGEFKQTLLEYFWENAYECEDIPDLDDFLRKNRLLVKYGAMPRTTFFLFYMRYDLDEKVRLDVFRMLLEKNCFIRNDFWDCVVFDADCCGYDEWKNYEAIVGKMLWDWQGGSCPDKIEYCSEWRQKNNCMKTQKEDAFRLEYTLDAKPQNITLTFLQGKKKYELFWEEAENEWENVLKWCENLQGSIQDKKNCLTVESEAEDCRRNIFMEESINPNSGKKDQCRLFITSCGWQEERTQEEWIKRKKIYASFEVSYREAIKAFYNILVALACDRKYVGKNKRFTKESKYSFLSADILKALSPDGWYMRHSEHVLACLKKNAYTALDFYNRGLALYNKKRYKAALKDYTTAIDRKDELSQKTIAWCYRERGKTYHKLKKYKEAEKDLLTAVNLDKKYSYAYTSLSALYTDMKLYDKVRKINLRGIKQCPSDSCILYNMADSYCRKKQWKKALECLKIMRKNDRQDAAVLIQMGRCYLGMRQFRKEKDICESVLADLLLGKIRFEYPESDCGLLRSWSKEFLKRKEYSLAMRLGQAGKDLGFKGYDALLKKIAKQAQAGE